MPKSPLASIMPREGRARRLDLQTLVTVAGELADRDGPDALTLAALAQATGIKSPSLYAHVESLVSLRRKLAALGLRELEQEIARACLGVSGGEAVKAACYAYRDYARRRPGVYAATVLWTSDQDEDIAAAGALLRNTVLRVLQRSPASDDHDEQVHLLRLMRVSLHGYVALEAAHAFAEPVDVDETFGRLVSLLTGLVLGGVPDVRGGT
jgi:AcrR family transcriptional regulator